MADFSVTITMDQKTVNALKNDNYFLYAFKAVQSGAKGSPTVWFQSQTFLTSTSVKWSEAYKGYISSDAIVPGGLITASSVTALDPDQKMNVGENGQLDVVAAPNVNHSMQLNNKTQTQYTSGISQRKADGSFSNLCAFNLYGKTLIAVKPINKVLMMFATETVVTDTVVERAFASGIMVDLTDNSNRPVVYAINAGWSWGGGSWGKEIDADSDMNPLLIEPMIA